MSTPFISISASSIPLERINVEIVVGIVVGESVVNPIAEVFTRSEVVLLRSIVILGSENRLEADADVGGVTAVDIVLVAIFLMIEVTRWCGAFVTTFVTISATVFEVDVSATMFVTDSEDELVG